MLIYPPPPFLCHFHPHTKGTIKWFWILFTKQHQWVFVLTSFEVNVLTVNVTDLLYSVYYTCVCTINKPHFPKKNRPRFHESYPLRRMHFGQYYIYASSAALGWPGDGDCYLMHKMQSGGWPYPKGQYRSSLKAPSLCAAVLCSTEDRPRLLLGSM